MNYLEIAGTIIGLIYLWLEYRASVWLWIAGLVMPAIYLVVYYQAGLYTDFGISIYYLLASLYGLICWLKGRAASTKLSSANLSEENTNGNPDISNGNEENTKVNPETEESLSITKTPKSLYWPLTAIFLLLFVAIGIILDRFTDSTVPWADAFTTALSIVAMWMLARKYLEQWLVWIAADAACAILYTYKGLWFTSGLYLLYAVIAVFGYTKWIRLAKNHDPSPDKHRTPKTQDLQ